MGAFVVSDKLASLSQCPSPPSTYRGFGAEEESYFWVLVVFSSQLKSKDINDLKLTPFCSGLQLGAMKS